MSAIHRSSESVLGKPSIMKPLLLKGSSFQNGGRISSITLLGKVVGSAISKLSLIACSTSLSWGSSFSDPAADSTPPSLA